MWLRSSVCTAQPNAQQCGPSFVFVGGMVLQTNMSDILARIDDQNRLVKQEAGLSAAPAAVVHQLKNMNLPQQLKEMKLPDLPQAIKVMRVRVPLIVCVVGRRARQNGTSVGPFCARVCVCVCRSFRYN